MRNLSGIDAEVAAYFDQLGGKAFPSSPGKCPRCGTFVLYEKVCPKCFYPLGEKKGDPCSVCREIPNADAKFCMHCGNQLEKQKP